MRHFIQFFISRRLPLVPMHVYETLRRFCGSYPETRLLSLSRLLGQPLVQCTTCESQSWRKYELYRTPASICNITASWLWRCLDQTHPKVVIELGTGFSTLIIAAYAQLRKETTGENLTIISAEHDSHWHDVQLKTLTSLDLLEVVRLTYCPLETQTYFGQQVVSYSRIQEVIGELAPDIKADMVFVDGPPATLYGGPGRRGSLLQAISLTRDGGTILLHDALRAEEYKAIRDYQIMQSLGFTCHGIVPVWYGLAICEKVNKPGL